ncbi:uncharacterized protein ACRADG_009625 [Cochliomyia hominivorax]
MFNKKSKCCKQISPKTENDEMSHERQSQLNSIMRILSESLDKLRISLILSKMFQNPICVRQRLRGTNYVICLQMMLECTKELQSDTNEKSHVLSYYLMQIMDFFNENIRIIEYFKDWLDNLSSDDEALIQAFQLLLKITDERLQRSAISELNKEKKIHEIYHENESIKKNIKVTQNLLKSQCIKHKWKLAAKEGIIQKYEKDLATCKYENNIKIKQEIIRSSRAIKQIYGSSLIKRKELQVELERVKENYENLLKENLKQEKSARDEKNKLILELQNLIRNFDQTMGDKIKENLYLQEEYARQKLAFDEFLIVYKNGETEYEHILKAKEEEEKRQQEQKILLFMMNRSARAIQKHWRKFRRAQKKAAKRGKGKGKSKKK